MGLFSLKGRPGFLGRTRHTLGEMQELGREATQAALATLGKLAGTPVKTEKPRITLVPLTQLAGAMPALAGAKVAARFPFSGGATGLAITWFDGDHALRLAELLMGKAKGSSKKLGEIESSAIAEMTNIALNGAINAVAAAQNARFATGVPDLAAPLRDLAGFLRFDAGEADHAIVVETPFLEGTRGIEGTLALVFGFGAAEPGSS